MLNALMTASWDLHAFMVPVIAHERGMSASAIGTLLSAFALAATLSRLALPVVVQRVREWTMIAGALAMAAALFAVYPFLPSHLLMLECSFMLGVLLGGVFYALLWKFQVYVLACFVPVMMLVLVSAESRCLRLHAWLHRAACVVVALASLATCSA
jgi:predicted MFS family arabinose efflux permease